HLEKRADGRDARVQADEVHASEALHRRVAESSHVSDRSNVARDAHDAIAVAAELVDYRAQGAGLDVADRDPHSRRPEAVCQRAADAAAAAGHHAHLLGEMAHHDCVAPYQRTTSRPRSYSVIHSSAKGGVSSVSGVVSRMLRSCQPV